MLKRIALALLCLTGTANAAADTAPILVGIKECDVAEGTTGPLEVTIRFKVTETGALEDFSVVKSSGNPALDARIITCTAGFTYKPATHDGVAVSAYAERNYNSSYVPDLTGEQRAFAKLEEDADARCRGLFPIDRRFDLRGNAITLVGVARLPSGEVQTKIMQSAGPKPDANAVKCLLKLVPQHIDLPAAFVRMIAVDWSHR